MADEITAEDLDLLAELGVDTTSPAKSAHSPEEQRVKAGFEEITRFVQERDCEPQHGQNCDIFERIYAVRLEQIRKNKAHCDLLKDDDPEALLIDSSCRPPMGDEELSDEELLASLDAEASLEADVTVLRHVRSRAEVQAAEERAQRTQCVDFSEFQPIFQLVQGDLKSGLRQTKKFEGNAEVKLGSLFVLDGQTAYVAALGDEFVSDKGKVNRRLRVIYSNGTENDILLRSFVRALNKDKTSRRITEPSVGPLFSDEEEDGDLSAGYIYVLRSQSKNAFISEHREVIHKIGVTGGDVKKRVANAAKDSTFLLADVEVVATYQVFNINRKKLEALLHRFFSCARLDLELKDRFGGQIEPREWFMVPLTVIDEAVEMLQKSELIEYRYDHHTATLIKCDAQ